MTDTETEAVTSDGTVPSAINNPWECQTVVIDGVLGIAFNSNLTRIQLVEHFPTEGKTVAKHVANIVIQNDQFLKFSDAIAGIAEQMRSMGLGEGT